MLLHNCCSFCISGEEREALLFSETVKENQRLPCILYMSYSNKSFPDHFSITSFRESGMLQTKGYVWILWLMLQEPTAAPKTGVLHSYASVDNLWGTIQLLLPDRPFVSLSVWSINRPCEGTSNLGGGHQERHRWPAHSDEEPLESCRFVSSLQAAPTAILHRNSAKDRQQNLIDHTHTHTLADSKSNDTGIC